MQIVIENLTEAETLDYPLPDGGAVPAGETRTFSEIEEKRFDEFVKPALDADCDAGKCAYFTRPDGTTSDFGGRIYRERLVVKHGDLTDADTSQTNDGSYAFPAGSILMGFNNKTTTAFAGGAVSALVADLGFDGASLGDVLSDGQTIMSAAERYGAGANALPYVRRDIGGQKIRAKIDSTDGNVADLTAGRLQVDVFYVVMGGGIGA